MSIFELLSNFIDFSKNHRDSVYFGLLVLCFLFSFFVMKRIYSSNIKKWMSTSLGLVLVCFVMKQHVWHSVLMTFIAAFLSIYTNKSRCHIIVFSLMLIYLTAFRLLIRNENRDDYVHMNIMLMIMTCKLAGVAFEINRAFRRFDKNYKKPYIEENEDEIEPKFFDVLHYAFSYFGMLVGPYIRYRTFQDFLNFPFARYSDFKYVRSKIIYVPIYLMLYIFFENIWPLQYAVTESFRSRNFYYKFLYGALQYQKFRFWMYTGLSLAECICATAGLGAYPTNVNSVSTHGPTTNYNALKQITQNKAKTLSYDFNTISNIDVYYVQTCPWISIYNRAWNKSIQYFMAMYVNKEVLKIPFLNKISSFITIILCAYWHGIELGFQIGMIFLPICTFTDKIYISICKHVARKMSIIIEIVMYVYQYHVVGYGVMSCLLLEPSKIYRYYSSVMFLPYFFMLCVHIIGMFLLSLLKLKNKK